MIDGRGCLTSRQPGTTGKTERRAMALDSRAKAAVALNRFGFMPKAGAPSDPRAALLADLANPTAGQIANHELPSVGEAARATFAFRQERKEQRLEKAATARGDMAGYDAKSTSTASNAKPDMAKQSICRKPKPVSTLRW